MRKGKVAVFELQIYLLKTNKKKVDDKRKKILQTSHKIALRVQILAQYVD